MFILKTTATEATIVGVLRTQVLRLWIEFFNVSIAICFEPSKHDPESVRIIDERHIVLLFFSPKADD